MTPRLWAGAVPDDDGRPACARPAGSSPTPEPAAAPGHQTTDGHVTPRPSVPAPPPPETSPGPADRPLTPDVPRPTADLAPILLAAADKLAAAGQPGDQLTTRDLVGALVDGALAAGSDVPAVADAQAGACYALLTAQLGLSPLIWADRPGSTRQAAVTALTTTARKAATS